MTTTTVNVSDMFCENCSGKIVRALKARPGVGDIHVNPLRRDVFISHDLSVSATEIMDEIQSLGFSPRLDQSGKEDKAKDTLLLRQLGVAGICAMQVMMIHVALYAGFFQGMEPSIHRLLSLAAMIFCIPIVTYSAKPFFTRGLLGVWHRSSSINMDTPIALAIGLAFLISSVSTITGTGEVYFDSVAMFTFLMLGARYLDQRLRTKLQVADALADNLPKKVLSWPSLKEIQLEHVQVDDELWINEGEQLPVDGTLASTRAQLDCTLLSGESEPTQLSYGDPVYAGTINAGPGFILRTQALRGDTRVAAIDRIAAEAAREKKDLSRLADQVARIFVPVILSLAALTYVGWSLVGWSLVGWSPVGAVDPISAALAVLVISCPCALSLATPAAINAALTNLRQRGLLVRHSQILELANKFKHVVFDKTGTLTQPFSSLANKKQLGDMHISQCLSIAAALERHSSHPIARAFKPFDNATCVEHISVDREGITGQIGDRQYAVGNTHYCGIEDSSADVFLTQDSQPIARFSIARQLRSDAFSTVQSLRDAGLDVHLLSGDEHARCKEIADTLMIPYRANEEPESKQTYVNALDGVLFVGDGLNDLPALAAADASLVTMETIDLVKSKADAILTTEKLNAIPMFIRIGRRCRQVMKQNLIWALAYNLIAIPIAISGLAAPWLAALGMSLSSLLVMLNSTRLLRIR